ncbi:MAG: hypothetical protein M3Q30_23725 [Actinomycetota bacterium]|nr:hypothetical protein [Actinomycetota bacterium]
MPVSPPGEGGLVLLAQAMDVVSVQADCTLDEALTLISDRAIVDHRDAYEIAAAVIDRKISFGG